MGRDARAGDYAGRGRPRLRHLADLVRWRRFLRPCPFLSHATCPRDAARKPTQNWSSRCRGRRLVHDRPAQKFDLAWLCEVDKTNLRSFTTGEWHTAAPGPGGFKGVGEGGAIGAPPAVVNAISDALAPFDIEITRSPRGEYEITDYVTKLAAQRPFHVVRSTFWFPIGDEAAWNAAQKLDLEKVLTKKA